MGSSRSLPHLGRREDYDQATKRSLALLFDDNPLQRRSGLARRRLHREMESPRKKPWHFGAGRCRLAASACLLRSHECPKLDGDSDCANACVTDHLLASSFSQLRASPAASKGKRTKQNSHAISVWKYSKRCLWVAGWVKLQLLGDIVSFTQATVPVWKTETNPSDKQLKQAPVNSRWYESYKVEQGSLTSWPCCHSQEYLSAQNYVDALG